MGVQLFNHQREVTATAPDFQETGVASEGFEDELSQSRSFGFPRAPDLPGIRNPPLPPRQAEARRPTKWDEEAEWKRKLREILPVDPIPGDVRFNAVNLAETLDMELLRHNACRMGEKVYCPTQHFLYSAAFDHLIHEATKECLICGMLLHRIRDEGRLTLGAYETIANAAIAFGNRILGKVEDKARAEAEAESQMSQYQNQETHEGEHEHDDAPSLTALIDENSKLQQENQELRLQIEQLEHVGMSKKNTTEASRWSELQLLRRSNQQLQFVLDAVEPGHQ